MMKTFAFIVHPISIKQVKDFWPPTRLMPDFLLKSLLKNTPPFKVSQIKRVRSIQGKETEGYFINCPLLPQQMLDLDEKFVLNKIIAGGHIAEKLGASILGLGGYTSVVADKGYSVAQNLKVPVTTGNTLTAWSVFEAIYRFAKHKNIDLKKSTLAVIGATGSIGSLCTRKFCDYVAKIIITARHRDKLERLKADIQRFYPINIIIGEDAHQVVKEADIVITTTSAPEAILSIEEFNPKSIVCDVSVPKNITTRENPNSDITVIDGGLIKLPYSADFGVDTGLPEDIIYACMAETMLLALEERWVSYSLGDNLNLDKMEEIADMAAKHGFTVWVPGAPIL
jgi:predicted amino acid dehydrogenase